MKKLENYPKTWTLISQNKSDRWSTIKFECCELKKPQQENRQTNDKQSNSWLGTAGSLGRSDTTRSRGKGLTNIAKQSQVFLHFVDRKLDWAQAF